jgi:hypothetical protein
MIHVAGKWDGVECISLQAQVSRGFHGKGSFLHLVLVTASKSQEKHGIERYSLLPQIFIIF